MERENKKRGREGDEMGTNAKKMEICNYMDNKDRENSLETEDDPCVPVGIFDFPWMKDGMMMFKTEDCSEFDKAVSSCLNVDDACNTILYHYSSTLLNFHDDLSSIFRVDEPDDGGADCIWSWVLDKPLATAFNKL